MFNYRITRGIASGQIDTITLDDLGLAEDLEPRGLVADENGHLWFAATNSESGSVVEVNPETKKVISNIGMSIL